MIWAVPPSETGDKYQSDDVIAAAIKTAATVELKVSDITFEGATVSATRKGCDIYYTGITDKSNYSPDAVIEDVSFMMAEPNSIRIITDRWRVRCWISFRQLCREQRMCFGLFLIMKKESIRQKNWYRLKFLFLR
ncbi:hypothetical protein SFC43_02515 [Bacteroides sp. CR5/BHMF/2]|nr:hypothetical protein [Bacteroides sp. CR5/BHMF/2]